MGACGYHEATIEMLLVLARAWESGERWLDQDQIAARIKGGKRLRETGQLRRRMNDMHEFGFTLEKTNPNPPHTTGHPGRIYCGSVYGRRNLERIMIGLFGREKWRVAKPILIGSGAT